MLDAAERLWELDFATEVSTRYHDWRRSGLGLVVNTVRAVALGGAIISLIAIFVKSQYSLTVVAYASAAIAIVTLIDLVFQFDSLARKHSELYRRFKELQVRIARERAEALTRISEWEALAQEIRMDEPPVLWAIYAQCWNQTVGKYHNNREHMRKIGAFRYILGGIYPFAPKDFPFETA
jgi:hypothetical protein